jgi:carbonic anhydrase/acetyltransferase-like protein (isoleucine patch superfamily)
MNSGSQKKYELTDITRGEDGLILHRIRALRRIPTRSVSVGDLGGWVESEQNLSQYDDAWIRDDACVYGNAWVGGSALISGGACVYNDAEVIDSAWVCGHAVVRGDASIRDRAHICGEARVRHNAAIFDRAKVSDHAVVDDYARVYGDAEVSGNAAVYDYARIEGTAFVGGEARVGHSITLRSETVVDRNGVLFLSLGGFFPVNATKTHFRIGCRTLKWAEYIAQFEALLVRYDAKPDEAAWYRLAFETAKKTFWNRGVE